MNTRSGFNQDPGSDRTPPKGFDPSAIRRIELEGLVLSKLEDDFKKEPKWSKMEPKWSPERLVMEHAPVGIFRTDEAGFGVFTNPRWRELTQMTAEEASGLGWTRSIHPEDRKDFLDEWSRFARTGTSFHLQYRIARADGTTICVLCQAKPLRDAEGDMKGCIGTITDLTERQGLEREQLKLSKLESLGVLAGGIAHDFNNQLTPIILNLAHVIEGALDDETRQRLTEAKVAAEEASHLTSQLLTFARGGDPVVQTIRLPQLLRRCLTFSLRGTSVCGELAIDEGLWPVNVDGGQLNQAIQNLVINARQALPDGAGTITVAAENVLTIRHPSLPKIDGRFVHISVADTGSGIAPEDLDYIFDPYYTTKAEGHGLGLACALSIVRNHEGQIAVTSEPGAGTTFSIYLPASDAEPEAVDQEAAEASVRAPQRKTGESRARFRILVMDDEELIRTSTQLLLTKLGYDVLTAAHGEEALDLYRKHLGTPESIDLVLMDLTIPGGMGGKDAIVALKNMDPEAKAIVFSGYSDTHVMANFAKYGFCAAIGKPFQPQELAASIEKHLASA